MESPREFLYREGMRRALRFCTVNKIPPPVFMTYDELHYPSRMQHTAALLQKLKRIAPLVGAQTGLYRDGHVFVNLPVTALPVRVPAMRSWSWPCYKTDRTAMGVVAHELGHYVEDILQKKKTLKSDVQGIQWRVLIEFTGRKPVSGYEPVPSEAWAESMRLFILNPDLLRLAIPARYNFIREFLKPSERRTWSEVLGPAHKSYFTAAERWIKES